MSWFLSPTGNKRRRWTVAHTFPRPLEKEPHDKNLQACHTNHQPTFHHAKIEDARLGALDGAEVTIFARTEVFLVAGDRRQLARDFVEGFFEGRGLFRRRALFARELGAGFILDLFGSARVGRSERIVSAWRERRVELVLAHIGIMSRRDI